MMAMLAVLEDKLNSEGTMSPSEQAKLVELVKYYRKLLAMKTAEYAYVDMKNFGQIDQEIRPYGYRLVKIINSRIPVLEELASSVPPARPQEKVAGATHTGEGW